MITTNDIKICILGEGRDEILCALNKQGHIKNIFSGIDVQLMVGMTLEQVLKITNNTDYRIEIFDDRENGPRGITLQCRYHELMIFVDMYGIVRNIKYYE